MNRGTPEYNDAIGRVKVSIFTGPPYNLNITGLIHVGTNYGYEMRWYQRMGIVNLMGFEPLPTAVEQFQKLYPTIPIFPYALGDTNDVYGALSVYAGDGQGSTLLHEINRDPNALIVECVPVVVRRFDSIHWGLKVIKEYNCLVIDVQGFELQVLKGFGEYLDSIEMISVELSRVPLYEGEATAAEVCEWLEERGYMRISPIEDHNDVFFIHRRRMYGAS